MLLRRAPLLAAAVLAATLTARAEIEFVGVLITSARASFALSDEPGQPAAWRTLGQDFAGYTLREFDAQADTLVLTKNGAPLRVHLKGDAKIKNARLELSGTITIGASEKFEVLRATIAFDQENAFPLKDGVTWFLTPQRRPDGNIFYRLAIERPSSSGKPEKMDLSLANSSPGKPFKMGDGNFQFIFTPLGVTAP